MAGPAHGNSSRAHLRNFLARAARTVQPGELVLDAGAGRAQYRGLFAHARYEAADFLAVPRKNYAEPDYVCDLTAIPVEDERFDLVVCTQVLEHVPEPARALAEFHRVLEPGGRLWLTAPLFYAEHGPTTSSATRSSGCAACSRTRASPSSSSGGWRATSGRSAPGARDEPGAAGGSGGLGRGARGRARAVVARVARRLARHAADRLADLDLRHTFDRRGMPKNYRVVARR